MAGDTCYPPAINKLCAEGLRREKEPEGTEGWVRASGLLEPLLARVADLQGLPEKAGGQEPPRKFSSGATMQEFRLFCKEADVGWKAQ